MSMPALRRFVEEKTTQSPTERSMLLAQVLGLFTRQGGTGITKSTWQHPLPLQLALELGKAWSPSIPFTSVQINFHQSHAAHKGMQLHQDAFNLGGHCSFTLVMGAFKGGRVWLEEEHGTLFQQGCVELHQHSGVSSSIWDSHVRSAVRTRALMYVLEINIPVVNVVYAGH
eukprot:8602-Amphidinium_carterae.6